MGVCSEITDYNGSLLAAAKQFVIGIFFLGFHFLCDMHFQLGDNKKSTASESGMMSNQFLQLSLLERIGYMWIWSLGAQAKFFMAWKLGEAAATIYGYGSNGGKWNGNANADLKQWYTGQNVSAISKAWNQKTQTWLQTYIYFRVSKNRNTRLVATYATSAYWHGFYPGYYITFFALAFLGMIQDNLVRHVRPYFLPIGSSSKKLYDALSWAGMMWIMCWAPCGLMLSTLANCWALEQRLYHLPAISLLVGLFVVPMVPVKRSDKPKAS